MNACNIFYTLNYILCKDRREFIRVLALTFFIRVFLQNKTDLRIRDLG